MSKSQNHVFNLPGADLDHIVRLAAADLEKLQSKSLFITGGTGFFGKWLLAGLHHADAALGLGLKITVLSRNPAAFLRRHPELIELDNLAFVEGHIADFSVENLRPDYILHAAADTTAFTAESDERERSRAIVTGTKRMLELAQKSGVERLLNISSGAVYGAAAAKMNGAKEEEFAEARAALPYGEAKREAERICNEATVDFVTARAFAFLGPYLPLDAHFAAGNFLRGALRGGPIMVRGDGTALRSYLHPADLVVWLLRLMVRGQSGRAYNVGSDEAVTTAHLARLVANAAQPALEVVIQSVQPQGPQNIYLPNISRARNELALGVAIPLADAIARTLTYSQNARP